MICPCCSVGEVEQDSCDLCGYSIKANVATDQGPEGQVRGSAANAKHTQITVADRGVAGHSVAITVKAVDTSGKPVKSGGDRVVVAVNGANRARPAVTDVGNGTYTGTYTPNAAGTDRLAITLNGVPVQGSPFTITIGAGEADPSQTSATVPSGSAGETTTMTVTVRDANGNGMTGGGEHVVVELDGANADATITASDNDDSTYQASYVPTRSGTDEISITVNGQPIGGSPFSSVVVAGAADAKRSTATLPNQGVPGRGVAITVRVRDAYGNPRTTGGDDVVVAIKGANTVTPNVTDVGNGSYTATYLPRAVGTDTASITLGGRPVGGSPYAIDIKAGAADPSQTVVTVPLGMAGQPTTVVVTVRDAHGNRLPHGGETVAMSVTGANAGSPRVTDNGDGTFTASYTPTTVGIDDITILLNGTPIPGSPFRSTVEAGGATADRTRAMVPPSCIAGEESHIRVVTHDAQSNPLNEGGAVVVVVVEGANADADVELTDNDDGTYTASYTPKIAGPDTLRIAVDGAPIGGGPFSTTIHPGPSRPAQALAAAGKGHVGATTTIRVTTRDAFGNGVTTGGHALGIKVAGANADPPVECRDNEDGTYVATYVPVQAGTDYIAIDLDGITIGDSPLTSVVAPGSADASRSVAMLPSASRAGTTTNVVIVARDEQGNDIKRSGDDIAVHVSGANLGVPIDVTDNGDGTYLASYVATSAGEDEVTILLNGVHVEGSPFFHEVEPGAVDPQLSTATGPVMGKVGVLMTVSMVARDRYGNQLEGGGSDVTVTVTGANDGANVTVIDNRDGTYFATYTPKMPGKDRIAITIDGRPIGSGPIRPVVAVGAASGLHSIATVPNGRVGKPTVITIQARDASGNDLTVGGDKVAVEVSVANTVQAKVTDNRNGTHTATYTPAATGTDYVNITINGTPLANNPFLSQVDAGATDPDLTDVNVPPTGKAGQPITVFVRARDGQGNDVKYGGQMLRVAVSGANDASSMRITDNDDGTYTAIYTPTKAGEDRIALTMGAEPVGRGSFSTMIRAGDPSVVQSTVEFPPGAAGQLTPVTVAVRDAYRNPIVGCADLIGLHLSGTNTGSGLQLTDDKDGTYTATYTPTLAGHDVLTVTLSGIPLRQGPVTGKIHAGRAAADESRAMLTGSQAGQPTSITVTARDAYGNDAERGGDEVAIMVTGANAGCPVELIDNGDGSYTAAYTPMKAGLDVVAIMLNGASLSGTPIKHEVSAGPPANDMAVVDVPRCTAGELTTVSITLRDAYGNAVSTRGANLAMRLGGTNAGTNLTLTEIGAGRFTATYSPTAAGDDTLDIALNGQPIEGSPFSSVVGPGPIVPARCAANVSPGTAGIATTISITARDAHGNPGTGAAADFAVSVSGANGGTQVKIAELENGTYVATYTPLVTGTDHVSVTVRGTAIPGVPFASLVTDRKSGAVQRVQGGLSAPFPATRGKLRPSMMCPRCSVAEISEETDQCELCGFSAADETTVVPAVQATASSLEETTQAELGKRFRIRALLRHTPRSVVFLAQAADRRDSVALKVIPVAPMVDDATGEAFEEDASPIVGLRHPNIVPLLEFGTSPRFLWYTMDFVDGLSLAEVLQQSGSMKLDVCLRIIDEVGQALEFMHRLGIVHGNIKPSNIIVVSEDRVCLSDVFMRHAHVLSEYMAPEQFEPGKAAFASDQFSLALVTTECVIGRNPLVGSSPPEVAAGDLTASLLQLASERADVPHRIVDALEQAMRIDPAQRFLSVGEFTGALNGALFAPVTTAPKPAQPGAAPRARVMFPDAERRRWPVPLAMVFVVVVLSALAAFLIWKQQSAAPPVLVPEQSFSTGRGEASLEPTSATDGTTLTDAAYLTVRSAPWGQLFVDGDLIGDTPQANLPLAPGEYTIQVLRGGYEPWMQRISVAAGDSLRLDDVVLTAQVR